jgi:hypothetical protein
LREILDNSQVDRDSLVALLKRGIDKHVDDPPDSDWQRGFLDAVVQVYRETLNGRANSRVIAGQALVSPQHLARLMQQVTNKHGAQLANGFG